MTIAIIYITLGVLYTIACVMDGQDVKPLWKRWLGKKLAAAADYFHPINYCCMPKCKYYNLYLERIPRLRNNGDCNGVMLAVGCRSGRTLKLCNDVRITEYDVHDASRRYGSRAKDILVHQARELIASSLAKAVEQHNLTKFRTQECMFDMYVIGELEVMV